MGYSDWVESDHELERTLAALTARVYQLERAVAELRQEGSVPGATPAAAPGAGQVAAPGAAQAAAPGHPDPEARHAVIVQEEETRLPAARPFAPAPTSPSSASSRRPQSLESRIGSQFLNRIGIFAVLIGVAWFLKLAIDRNYIGPGLRVFFGLAVAAGIFFWSERFRSQGFRAFAYTLKALATGIGYLSLWAAFSLYHLLPGPVAFLAMVALTLVNGVLAWRQSSELLAGYALAGGLVTPALLSTGQNHEVFLFSYLLLLDLGTLFLLAVRPWRRLATGSFLGTGVYTVSWAFSYYSAEAFGTTVFFYTLFFLLFAAAPLLLAWPLRRGAETPESSISPLLGQRYGDFAVLLAAANALFAAVEFLVLLGTPEHQAARPWASFVFGLFYLGLFLLAVTRGRAFAWSSAADVLSLESAHLGLALVFFFAAVPLRFHDYGITLGWLLEALAVLAAASRSGRNALRIYAFAGLLVALLSTLFLEAFATSLHPLDVVANTHFLTYVVGLAVFAAAVFLSLRAHAQVPQQGGVEHSANWLQVAGFASIAFSVIALLAVSLELHHYYYCGGTFYQDLCGNRFDPDRKTYAAFTLSAWLMLYGAALMAAGFWRRSSFLRWQALVLLAFSIGKVFLLDARHLTQGYRVLSFIGLGVLLLAVSFAYQRDWLGLRGRSA